MTVDVYVRWNYCLSVLPSVTMCGARARAGFWREGSAQQLLFLRAAARGGARRYTMNECTIMHTFQSKHLPNIS